MHRSCSYERGSACTSSIVEDKHDARPVQVTLLRPRLNNRPSSLFHTFRPDSTAISETVCPVSLLPLSSWHRGLHQTVFQPQWLFSLMAVHHHGHAILETREMWKKDLSSRRRSISFIGSPSTPSLLRTWPKLMRAPCRAGLSIHRGRSSDCQALDEPTSRTHLRLRSWQQAHPGQPSAGRERVMLICVWICICCRSRPRVEQHRPVPLLSIHPIP